ncbi:MAG: NADH/ubiquinone/plastoquinone (complex i) [Verrucomicrobia bacterium]|nr:NADH/ubiquinone/plastoquinone (complex i) [Verrucomicrobiota bacterium]
MQTTPDAYVFLVLLPAALFALLGGWAGWKPHSPARRFGSWIMVAGWVNLLAALTGAAITVGQGTQLSLTLGPVLWGFSARLDALSALVWLMIALLTVVILRYSRTYLDGDPRQTTFLGRMGLTIACVQTLVLAGNLGLLFAAWVGTSLSLHRLLVFYPERRAARLAAWKKFVAARLGDLCLFGAVVCLGSHFGTGDLETIFQAFRQGGEGVASFSFLGVTGLLLALAAMLKSAQFPFHGWLVEVMETPTPVSALLHAGILNAGPFLVVRLSPILHEAVGGSALLVLVGGFTGWLASAALLSQPSVKVALGYSSAAHMGFMLMVAGLGVYPAVMLHLVAHSFYKAHAFLSSGSVVDAAKSKGIPLPARRGNIPRVAASLGIALLVYAIFAWAWGVNPLDHPSLLAVGAILVLGIGQIIAPTLDSVGPRTATAMACLMAMGVAIAFFSLEAGAHALLHGILPHSTTPPPPILLLALLVVLTYLGAVVTQMLLPVLSRNPRLYAWSVHLRNGLYANAMLDRLAGSLRRHHASTHFS